MKNNYKSIVLLGIKSMHFSKLFHYFTIPGYFIFIFPFIIIAILQIALRLQILFRNGL